MAKEDSANQGARKDGCIPITNSIGLLARKLGGELFRNKDGVFVLRGMGADEAIFSTEAEAYDHLARAQRVMNMAAEAHTKMEEIMNTGGNIPVTNWEDLVKLHRHISDVEPVPRDPTETAGGEKAPYFARHKGGAGRLFDNPVGRLYMRGHALLMNMGEGGVHSANALRRVDTLKEQLEIQGANRIGQAVDAIDRWTTVKEMKTKTMPQEALDLHNKVVAPFIESVQRSRDFLGIEEDMIPEDGIPTWYATPAKDIPQDMVEKAHKAGYLPQNEGRDELARMFADPMLGGRRAGESQIDFKKRMDWMKKQANGLAGQTNHVRAGEEGYLNSYKATMLSWNRAVSQRIAEASVFGPNHERITQAAERIGADSPFGTDSQKLYHAAMKELMGHVYVPRTEFELQANNIMRFMLGSSMSRHIAQLKIAIMQNGLHGTASGLAKELFHAPSFPGTVREFNSLGVTMHQMQHFVDEHPSDMMLDRSLEERRSYRDSMLKYGTDATGALARLSTFGLHFQLNFDRVFAGILAKNNFDDYYVRALKGDRNKLGLFADMLGFGHPESAAGREKMIADLKGMDRRQVRGYFIKRMSDTTGTTFHPGDLPNLKRVRDPITEFELGAWLAKFRAFKWSVMHNIWNQMTSPNYSKAYRARVFGRMLATTPLSAVDPFLRSIKVTGITGLAGAIGVGVANLDSKIAHDAWDKAMKDPKTSDMLYALTTLWVNDGTLGIAADMVQGWNLQNPWIFGRALMGGSLPGYDQFTALAIGSSLAAHGALSGDKKAKLAAQREFMSDSPFGNALAYGTGARSQPRVPKHQVIKEGLEFGAKKLGLED